MEKVLVIGASGFIAIHCINELLNVGYAVKGSLRNNKSDNKRIIATSPQGINIMEISNILRKNGYKKSPQNFIPTKMINSLAPI